MSRHLFQQRAGQCRGDLTADWRAKNPGVESADKLLARFRFERRSQWEAAELVKLTAKGKRPANDRWKSGYEEPLFTDDEDLAELPPGWRWTPLELIRAGDAPMVYGIILPGEDISDGIPYVRPVDIGADGTIDLLALKRTSIDIANQYSRASLKAGDIILSIVGTIGKVAVASTALEGANITQSSIRIRPGGATSTEFLKWVLQAPCLVRQYEKFRFGNAVQRLNVEHVRQLVVPLPPREEQLEICSRVQDALARVKSINIAGLMDQIARIDSSLLAKAFRGELVPQDPNEEPAAVLLERICTDRDSANSAESVSRGRSRKPEAVTQTANDIAIDETPQFASPEPVQEPATDLTALDQATLHAEVFAALWTYGPLEKDDAARKVAEHLRQIGYVEFQRLRADGPLYSQILDAIESAVKAGRLDRPKRGYIRACKSDATAYTADDWRHALLASLSTEAMERDEAIRVAAEWARDNLGLEFALLRSDGHIVEGLRSAINSAIRRGQVTRHGATHISRAAGSGQEEAGQQLSLRLGEPAGANQRSDARSTRRRPA